MTPSTRGAIVLGAALAWLGASCAEGGPSDPMSGRDGGRPEAGPREDGATGACSPPCDGSQRCIDGRCVAAGTDADGDGVPAGEDCNDMEPGIRRDAERTCSSACGTGVERCRDGVWAACTAPDDCDCDPAAAPRSVPCERCGLQRQVCEGGRWRNDGACSSGACAAGEVEMSGTCGACGRMERRCRTDCTWEDFTCAGEGECMAGEVDMESAACGECGEGTRTRTRTCSAACGWGGFGEWSCSTDAQCSPGDRDTETESCGCMGAGTRSRSRACDAGSCRWGGFGSWGSCSASGSCCGDGSCAGGETCDSCEDCRAGHLGTGENDDPCPGVPAEQWRCVTIPTFGTRGSQVCRGGRWVTFHLNPRDCNACRCAYTSACMAP